MRILIVEDDAFKSKQIQEAIHQEYPSAVLDHASSLQEAVDLLYEKPFDIVLLDMAIPSHSNEGGSTDVYSQPVGGLDVLLYLSFDCRPERIMVLTQYPTIEYNREHIPLSKFKARLEKDSIHNLSAISLFGDDGAWRGSLTNFLRGEL